MKDKTKTKPKQKQMRNNKFAIGFIGTCGEPWTATSIYVNVRRVKRMTVAKFGIKKNVAFLHLQLHNFTWKLSRRATVICSAHHRIIMEHDNNFQIEYSPANVCFLSCAWIFFAAICSFVGLKEVTVRKKSWFAFICH